MKKISAIFMALLMILALVSCFGEDDEDKPKEYKSTAGLKYELSEDGSYYICTGIGSATADELVIGSTYNNLPVKEIGAAAFAYNNSFHSITVPESIIAIGAGAFEGCNSLTFNVLNGGMYLGNKENEYYAFINLTGSAQISSEFTMSDETKIMADASLKNNVALTQITLGKGLTSVPKNAFSGCTSISVLTIPTDSTIVAEDAFADCPITNAAVYISQISGLNKSKLEIVSLLGGESIEESAFYGCSRLTSITIPSSVISIGKSAFEYCISLTSITIPNSVTSIGSFAFRDCTSLTSITIPSSVTSIGNYAFSQCTSLTSITIPNSVTSIGSYAFRDCTSLTSIEIPSSVTSIDESAFSGCTSLISVEIPDSITSIGVSLFEDCEKLQYNEYDNAYYIGNSNNPYLILVKAKNKSITTCKINDNTKFIYGSAATSSNDAFEGCSNLTHIDIPSGVKHIGSYAFKDCTRLASISLPDSITDVSSSSFEGCTSLKYNEYDNAFYLGNSSNPYVLLVEAKTTYITSNVINDGTKIILAYAFYNCTSLESVAFADGSQLKSIGNHAFRGCGSLMNITIPSSVTSIGIQAFYPCTSLTSINIPQGVTSIGEAAFSGCTSLESITVESGNTVYHSAGNCLIETETKTLIAGCKNSVIPTDGSVTRIGDYAFADCTSLTSIEIPSSVTSIGYEAFYDCTSLNAVYIGDMEAWLKISFESNSANPLCYANNLYLSGELVTEVSVPNTITEINASAFYGCTSLTSITIPNSVTSIGSYAFRDCTSLTSIEIPSSVTSIGYEAFYRCTSLTSIEIPSSFTSLTDITIPNIVTAHIASSAFQYCHKLVEIYNLSPLNITKGSTSYGYVGCYALDIYNDINTPSKLSTTSDGYIFYSDGTNTYLMGYKGSDTELTLPESYNGGSYKIYKYAFYENNKIKSITIPNSVTSIGYDAFSYCTSLESVTFAEGSQLESIGSSAFSRCTSLKSIEIPQSVTSIGDEAFLGCTSLNAVYISDIEAWLKISFADYYANPLYYAGNLYLNGELVTEVTVPNTITKINAYAFSGCTSLESVTFADGSQLESIGYYAFYGCTSLMSITIPSSVTSIGERAFLGCYKLVEVYNLSSLNITKVNKNFGYVGWYALDIYNDINTPSKLSTTSDGYIFYSDGINTYLTGYKGSETELTLPESYNGGSYKIYEHAFSQNDKITSITIPNSVTSIDESAFSGCTSLNAVYISDMEAWLKISFGSSTANPLCYAGNLYLNGELVTEVTVPNTITKINAYAFSGCTSLTSITIPNSVTSIGSYAFRDCTSLTSITIPNSVTSIDDSAFYYCTSLKSIEIPSSVTSIGEAAFIYCASLTSITIPSSVTSIGINAFWGCESLTIYAEARIQPSGWSSGWNDSNRPVIWGYNGE